MKRKKIAQLSGGMKRRVGIDTGHAEMTLKFLLWMSQQQDLTLEKEYGLETSFRNFPMTVLC